MDQSVRDMTREDVRAWLLNHDYTILQPEEPRVLRAVRGSWNISISEPQAGRVNRYIAGSRKGNGFEKFE